MGSTVGRQHGRQKGSELAGRIYPAARSVVAAMEIVIKEKWGRGTQE